MTDIDDIFSAEAEESDTDGDLTADFEYPEDISQIPSEQLCDVVISFQYLGIVQDYAIRCMQELALRRANGDSFAFEEYITSELKKLPKLDAQQPFISNLFRIK